MKHTVFLLFIAAALVMSCSNSDDVNDGEAEQNAIVGEWEATELKIDSETAGADAKFGKQIFDFLTERDCTILTFNFKVDGTVQAENSANYLEINATLTGLDVPCPTESDIATSTYTYDGAVLTTIDEDGETLTVDVTITDDTMTLDATDLDIENFNDEGFLIFKRK